MAWPDWAGPFGIPTDSQELLMTAASTGALYGIGWGLREAHIGWELSRMPQHRWDRIVFNRKALKSLARRQIIFPSVSNAASIWSRILFANPGTVPLVVLLGLMYIGAKARPGENQFETDRVARAIDYTRGTRDHWWDTSWLVSHGYFHESPHHGDHWYSFNPQDIDGSHR